jgi:hypothetical protein
MPDPESFVVPYPCYFPLMESGDRLITVTVDGMPAVVFLTDKDLAERFCQEWSQGNHGKSTRLLQCAHQRALLETVREVSARTKTAGIEHVAIDPGGRYKCAYVPIRDFVAYVESLPME